MPTCWECGGHWDRDTGEKCACRIPQTIEREEEDPEPVPALALINRPIVPWELREDDKGILWAELPAQG